MQLQTWFLRSEAGVLKFLSCKFWELHVFIYIPLLSLIDQLLELPPLSSSSKFLYFCILKVAKAIVVKQLLHIWINPYFNSQIELASCITEQCLIAYYDPIL